MVKYIEQWCDEFDVKILDCDGFSVADIKRKLTEEEFMRGIVRCTVMAGPKFRERIVKEASDTGESE